MFYLNEIGARPREDAMRNAGPEPNPKAVLAKDNETISRWVRLVKVYFDARGGRPGPNRKWIPKTTNADVMQLATLWSRELAKVKPQNRFDRTEHRQWKACVDKVNQTVDRTKPNAEYADNEHFWQRCTRKLSIYLRVRKVRPSQWSLFKEALVESLAAVPTTIGTAGRAAAGAVGGAATTVIGQPAKLALVVLGGALLAPPIIRAVRT